VEPEEKENTAYENLWDGDTVRSQALFQWSLKTAEWVLKNLKINELRIFEKLGKEQPNKPKESLRR